MKVLDRDTFEEKLKNDTLTDEEILAYVRENSNDVIQLRLLKIIDKTCVLFSDDII